MQYQTFGERVARTTRRVIKITVISLVILAIAFLCMGYWGIYDEGVRAGTVLRISKKGMIFKTYEGQLNVQTFGAFKGANPIMEAFDFSVSASDDEVIRELEEVSLSGERVNLHYISRYATFPWRGDTKYFIVKVERVGQ
ncbi:MAG: hypothetical protein WEB30_17570 [Cyclobacteriaceae bacterium]